MLFQNTRLGCGANDQQVLCGVCNPYSAHLYTRMGTDDGLAMSAEFCDSFVTACGADLGLPNSYCAEHVLDGSKTEYWSYPLNVVGESRVHGHFAAYFCLDILLSRVRCIGFLLPRTALCFCFDMQHSQFYENGIFSTSQVSYFSSC